jgi:hypothetical protein
VPGTNTLAYSGCSNVTEKSFITLAQGEPHILRSAKAMLQLLLQLLGKGLNRWIDTFRHFQTRLDASVDVLTHLGTSIHV